MLEPLFGLAVPGYCGNRTAHHDGRDPLLLKIQRPLSKVTKTKISHTFKQSYTNENLIMEEKNLYVGVDGGLLALESYRNS